MQIRSYDDIYQWGHQGKGDREKKLGETKEEALEMRPHEKTGFFRGKKEKTFHGARLKKGGPSRSGDRFL